MSFRTTLSRFVLVAALCCVALHDRTAVAAEEVLKNQDVVKMISAGFAEEVILAKVREAPRVDFQLSVDDLVALRKAGVTDRVQQAMLERDKLERNKPTHQSPARSVGNLPGFAGYDSRFQVETLDDVSLKTAEGTTPLHLVRGTVGSSGFGAWSNTFMNYAGTRSPVRSHDRRPVLLVLCTSAPEVGRYFFAKLDSDKKNGVRSLKLGGFITRTNRPGGRLAPDKDWVLPFEVKEETQGTWRITVNRDLEPGEYGLYVNLQADASQGVSLQGGGIFDFGID